LSHQSANHPGRANPSHFEDYTKTTFFSSLTQKLFAMKRFSFLLILGIVAISATLQSCQKEAVSIPATDLADQTAEDRAQLVYGVTVFSAGNPGRLHTMEAATGNITNTVAVYVLDALGQPFFLDDLKGVCVVNDQVFVTTGFNVVDAYSNLLVKVNPATGQAGILSNSPAEVGTVSDIDYNPNNNTIYGLANNSNKLVSINDNANNWGTYANVGNITGLGSTYRAKGLSMVRDAQGLRISVAATLAAGGNARIYTMPNNGGVATFLTSVLPIADLAAGHCGIGFDLDMNAMLINRNSINGLGLNSFGWVNAFGPQTNSAFWGGNGQNFEDLSSDVQ
jgi:hypothetical protein